MKKIAQLFILLLSLISYAQTVPAYVAGDYRSAQSGNWTSPSSWQVYNGTTFVAAASYPGAGTTAANEGNYKAVVQPGHTITVSESQTFYFGDLYILANPLPTPANAATVSYGQVTLSTNGTILSLLGSNQDVYIFGGKMFWSGNNTVLVLNLGTSIILTNYNGLSKASGSNILRPETQSDGCTGNQQIHFIHSDGSTVTNYAVCNGGNASYRFQDLNWGGGSIQAVPSVSATEICAGNAVNLSGTYTGYIPPDGSQVTYIWNTVSAPAGYTFGPTVASASANQTLNLTIPGVYQFSLRAQYYSSTFATYIYGVEYVEVKVNPTGSSFCACYKDPVIQQPTVPGEIVFPSQHGFTSLGRAGKNNSDQWPQIRESAQTVLESKTKGFVMNRLTSAQLQQIINDGNARDGMMAYDTDAGCLKIYVQDAATPSNSGWHCFNSPACPD